MYLHEKNLWWQFRYDKETVMERLATVCLNQGKLIGRMSALGFSIRENAMLHNLSETVVKSSEIEGESIDYQQVRSSIARRLSLQTSGLTASTAYVEGVVEMMLDATQNCEEPLTYERLFRWHQQLFPPTENRLYAIDVGVYRTHRMQVVSGPMGMETVLYEAPAPERVPDEMAHFLEWMNNERQLHPILKAAIAHLWFVTIHPFDDGNGRIARALSDMLLARADGTQCRFYSMSQQIMQMRKSYYATLEETQKGDGDITEWLLWFLDCLGNAINAASETVQKAIDKSEFWDSVKELTFNERQRKMLNKLLDGFEGNLTAQKWSKICHCSADTALNDIKDLIQKQILSKAEQGGRSAHYLFPNNSACRRLM